MTLRTRQQRSVAGAAEQPSTMTQPGNKPPLQVGTPVGKMPLVKRTAVKAADKAQPKGATAKLNPGGTPMSPTSLNNGKSVFGISNKDFDEMQKKILGAKM